MSGLVKGVKKVIGKVVSGVKKVFKKIASSKIGKVILIAAAVYLGGAALGHWSIPGQSGFASTINGAWANVPVIGAGTAAPAANAGVAGMEAGMAANGASVLPQTVAAGSEGVSTSAALKEMASNPELYQNANAELMAANSTRAAGSSAIETGMAANGASIPVTPTDALVSGGGSAGSTASDTVARMMEGTRKLMQPVFGEGSFAGKGGWISQNQTAALMGGSAIAGAFTPDAIDVAREQDRLEEERRKKRQSDFLIGDVDVGRPNNTQLTRNGGLLFPRGGST